MYCRLDGRARPTISWRGLGRVCAEDLARRGSPRAMGKTFAILASLMLRLMFGLKGTSPWEMYRSAEKREK